MSEPLTVKALIELLGFEDPDAIVWLEGCDCDNQAHGLENDGSGNILITIIL